jgi:hypothetical protein
VSDIAEEERGRASVSVNDAEARGGICDVD